MSTPSPMEMSPDLWKRYLARLPVDEVGTDLAAQRDEAVTACEAQAAAYDEAMTRAVTKGTALPTPPPSAAAIDQSFQARGTGIDRDEQKWLGKHRDELVALAHGREDEIMIRVADLGRELNGLSSEIQSLYSMLGHIAAKTQTPRPEVVPTGWNPPELLDLAAHGRKPLRAGEQPAQAQPARPEPQSIFRKRLAIR